MPHNSTGPGKKTTVFLSLRLPLVSGHFVSILRAKNTGRKRTSRDHGCSPVLLPCRSGRMSEIDADQCHFVMPFTHNCGRNAGYPAPPAQIRASGFPAYGSYLGCLALNRVSGYGCTIRGLGIHRLAKDRKRDQGMRSRWLRRLMARNQYRATWTWKLFRLCILPGTP